jgi:hypothetical protein
MSFRSALCLLACVFLTSQDARADTISFPTTFTTSGSFSCRTGIVCTFGPGSVTIATPEGGTATITFTGATTTFNATNQAQRVPFGEFTLTADRGFTFPTFPTNPKMGIVRVAMTLAQTEPLFSTGAHEWIFGPGGLESIRLQMGRSGFARSLPPNSTGYHKIVYTVRPFPFTLNPNSSTSLFVDAGVVPEPASLFLVGTGIAGLVVRRRRRQATDGTDNAGH